MAKKQNPETGWWQTLPGILTGVAGLVAAVAGLITILIQAGIIEPKKETASSVAKSGTDKGASVNMPGVSAPSGSVSMRTQNLSWGPDQGREAGVCIDECSHFISWLDFRAELERNILPRVPNMPSGTSARLQSLAGQKAKVIEVTDGAGNVVANVWVGTNPHADWKFDGVLRVGSPGKAPKVFASFERLSNGTYRQR